MKFIGIDTLVFSTPDMAKARRFYSDWGLEKVSDGKNGAACRRRPRPACTSAR